jgi:hypothetical protein
MTGAGVFIVSCLIALVVISGLMVAAVLHHYVRNWRLTWSVIAVALLTASWVGYDLGYLSSVEEHQIQERVAELCKDAGVKIVHRVEVEGFYDDTQSTGLGPPRPEAVAEYEKEGFRYYEKQFAQYVAGRVVENPEGKVVHIEKQNGVWNATLLKEPQARYQLRQARSDEKVGHKIWITEWVVVDRQTGESVGRDLLVKSLPNKVDSWWEAMIGDPTRYCPGFGYKEKKGSLRGDVLTPLNRKGN